MYSKRDCVLPWRRHLPACNREGANWSVEKASDIMNNGLQTRGGREKSAREDNDGTRRAADGWPLFIIPLCSIHSIRPLLLCAVNIILGGSLCLPPQHMTGPLLEQCCKERQVGCKRVLMTKTRHGCCVTISTTTTFANLSTHTAVKES